MWSLYYLREGNNSEVRKLKILYTFCEVKIAKLQLFLMRHSILENRLFLNFGSKSQQWGFHGQQKEKGLQVL